MRQKSKSLFGSSRASYFREAPRVSTKHRSQRVRIRRRYAASVLETWMHHLWTLVKGGLVAGMVGCGAYFGHQFWTSSPHLKVKTIQFTNLPPPGLIDFLPLKVGMNIVTIRPARIEALLLQRYGELKSVSIYRSLERTVTVDLVYRKPVAILEEGSQRSGVDEVGVLFALNEYNQPKTPVPQIAGLTAGPQLTQVVFALSKLSKELPSFYSLVKLLKTDKIQSLRFVLKNDVVILWSDFDFLNVVDRARRVQMVMDQYEPKHPMATLRFVTDDRIVMDPNWKKRS